MGWMYKGDPCLNCERRSVGCHATCEKYLGWKEQIRQKKEIIQGEENTRIILNEMQAIRTARIEKRKHMRRRK